MRAHGAPKNGTVVGDTGFCAISRPGVFSLVLYKSTIVAELNEISRFSANIGSVITMLEEIFTDPLQKARQVFFSIRPNTAKREKRIFKNDHLLRKYKQVYR